MQLPVTAQSTDSINRPGRLKHNYRRHLGERFIEALLFLMAFVSVAITIAIVAMLVSESLLFFEHVSLWEFLTDTQWTPLFDNAHYGILPLISGTVVSSAVALMIALPMGTITAIYLSEFAPFTVREVTKPFLELLGGVPTVVYGYFALLFVTPLLQQIFPELPGFNLLSAGLVMGIMIIPNVSTAIIRTTTPVTRKIRSPNLCRAITARISLRSLSFLIDRPPDAPKTGWCGKKRGDLE